MAKPKVISVANQKGGVGIEKAAFPMQKRRPILSVNM